MKSVLLWVASLLAHCTSADHEVVFSIAHYSPPDNVSEYENPYKGLIAQSIDASGDITTYNVWSTCKPTESCWGRQPTSIPMPTYTVAIGPSTFDWKHSKEPYFTSHTTCSFEGRPATKAECGITAIEQGLKETSVTEESHYTVPGTAVIDKYWSIHNATLRVVDVTPTPTTAGGSDALESSGAVDMRHTLLVWALPFSMFITSL